jgi:hypothetical protein
MQERLCVAELIIIFKMSCPTQLTVKSHQQDTSHWFRNFHVEDM